MTYRELDDLRRHGSAIAGAAFGEMYLQSGISILPKDGGAPGIKKLKGGSYIGDPEVFKVIRDHGYRLKYPDGSVVYMEEPYDFDWTDVMQMARLVENGWQIKFGGPAMHVPGLTIPIQYKRSP